jgi:TrpR-related protein YerC/YecD
MRTSQNKLNSALKNQLVKTFAQTLTDLKNSQEMNTFLTDFFNASELETFAKRLSVAYWLTKKRSYENIRTNIKVSSATIATIEKLLQKPGFALALKKMEAEEWASQWVEKIQKFIKK